MRWPLAIERFSQSVAVVDSGCWIWTSQRTVAGYGCFHDGRNIRAHRWAYEHFIGPIPAGLHLDHLCGNPACVCPEHLEPVTHKENMRRVRHRNLQATHCANGHLFTEENTRIATSQHGEPQRRCRACDRESMLRHRARHPRILKPRNRRTHCKHGHEFTPENTYVSKRGSRYCRICTRRLQRELRARKRAALSPSGSAE